MTTTRAEPTSIGWTPDDSTFGARLALVRQRMGWGNVKQAAEECGLPAESWRTWERDNVMPRQVGHGWAVPICGLHTAHPAQLPHGCCVNSIA